MLPIPIVLDERHSFLVQPLEPSWEKAPLWSIFWSVFLEFSGHTLKTLPASFAAEVLGIERGKLTPVANAATVAMKSLIWIVTTLYYFFENILYQTYIRSHSTSSDDLATLSFFLDKAINPRHLSQSREIDHLNPPRISIENLRGWIDQINLKDPTKLDYVGHMNEFQNGTDQGKLHETTDKIISHIKKKIATVGSPSAENYPLLEQFYATMDRNLSMAMGSVQSCIDQFNKNHPDQTQLTDAEKAEFKSLQENKARLILDISDAAQHCAARWNAQATAIYQMFQGGSQGPLSLRDHLFLILRRKREDIAAQFALEESDNDAHTYGKYMEQFGPLLGLRGAQGVVEYLHRKIPLSKAAAHFKSHYSIDAIIEAVQEEYRENPLFCTSVREWVREQLVSYVPDKIDDNAIVDEADKPTEAKIQEILKGENCVRNLQIYLGCTLSLAKQIINKQISWDMAYQEVKKQFKKGWIDSKLTNESSHFVKNKTATLSSEIMELLLVSFGIFFPQDSGEIPHDHPPPNLPFLQIAFEKQYPRYKERFDTNPQGLVEEFFPEPPTSNNLRWKTTNQSQNFQWLPYRKICNHFVSRGILTPPMNSLEGLFLYAYRITWVSLPRSISSILKSGIARNVLFFFSAVKIFKYLKPIAKQLEASAIIIRIPKIHGIFFIYVTIPILIYYLIAERGIGVSNSWKISRYINILNLCIATNTYFYSIATAIDFAFFVLKKYELVYRYLDNISNKASSVYLSRAKNHCWKIISST